MPLLGSGREPDSWHVSEEPLPLSTPSPEIEHLRKSWRPARRWRGWQARKAGHGGSENARVPGRPGKIADRAEPAAYNSRLRPFHDAPPIFAPSRRGLSVKYNHLAAMLVGLTVGLLIPAGSRYQEVQAQGQGQGQRWEYKVLVSDVTKAPFFSDKAAIWEKDYNALAADGWEFIGPFNPRDPSNLSVALFKRLKK
jgi:hypothetical protein